MGEVEGLSLGDQGSDLGPGRRLGGIRKQVHDDGSLLDSLGDIEKSLSGDPTVLLSLLPGFSTLSDTDNDLDTLVSGVEGLTVTLRSVTDHGKGVVLEEADFVSGILGTPLREGGDRENSLLEFVEGPVGSLVNDLLGSGKVEGLDTSSSLDVSICCCKKARSDSLRVGKPSWQQEPA